MNSIKSSQADGNVGSDDGGHIFNRHHTHDETPSKNPDESSLKESIWQPPCLTKSRAGHSSLPQPACLTHTLARYHRAGQHPQQRQNDMMIDKFLNLSLQTFYHLQDQTSQNWQRQHIRLFIRQLKPRAGRSLQMTTAQDTEEQNRGRTASSSTISGTLPPDIFGSAMLRLLLSSPILGCAKSNAKILIMADAEAELSSSSLTDHFGANSNDSPEEQSERTMLPKEQMDGYTKNPLGVNHPLLSISVKEQLLTNEPKSCSPHLHSSILFNIHKKNTLVSREAGHDLSKEAADKSTESTIIHHVSCKDSLDSPSVEIKLIENHDAHDHLKLDENEDDQDHVLETLYEAKLKAGSKYDVVIGDAGKNDQLRTQVVVLAKSPLIFDDAAQLLGLVLDHEADDRMISSQCKSLEEATGGIVSSPYNPTKVDLAFKAQDCDESMMSDITFPLDTNCDTSEEDECNGIFNFFECIPVISDHILDSMDLLCL